ncbi:hypothetical protein HPP92_027340 [Vanilla planifolia]|uniref:Uncharacterized protein n=1 Tax=Vanilla planifolia TaxID=51239 RepID=A0A835PCW2_VANPL|nr:hypothetical protein HPP92_027340 [Vanilla planifolia]
MMCVVFTTGRCSSSTRSICGSSKYAFLAVLQLFLYLPAVIHGPVPLLRSRGHALLASDQKKEGYRHGNE